jgi:hypothetical protein
MICFSQLVQATESLKGIEIDLLRYQSITLTLNSTKRDFSMLRSNKQLLRFLLPAVFFMVVGTTQAEVSAVLQCKSDYNGITGYRYERGWMTDSFSGSLEYTIKEMTHNPENTEFILNSNVFGTVECDNHYTSQKPKKAWLNTKLRQRGGLHCVNAKDNVLINLQAMTFIATHFRAYVQDNRTGNDVMIRGKCTWI